MEIRTLQYFLAVAREQNMTGAANIAITVSCLAAWKNTSSCRRRAKPF